MSRSPNELPPAALAAFGQEAELEPEGAEEAEAEKGMRLAGRILALVDWLTGFKPEDAEMECTVKESDLRELVEMAEECLTTRADEYSSYPSVEERAVLERVWGQLNRPIPDFFKKHFGWKEAAVA